MIDLPAIPLMLKAFAEKDRAFDGLFYVAVKTTGVFCRTVCRAKPARPENLEFYRDVRSAVREGYRPCKLCRPMDAAGPPEVVAKLIESIDGGDGNRLSERALRSRGIDPSTARRQFKAYCGMTFLQYQRARRMGRALLEVQDGQSVSSAQAGAGYASASGYRQALANLLGDHSAAAQDAKIFHAGWIQTPLGGMVAVAGSEGVAVLEFVDPERLEQMLAAFRRRQQSAGRAIVVVPEDQPHPYLQMLRGQLAEYFAGSRTQFTVPLSPAGSDFERAAWAYMRTIPFAQTRSYGEQARGIGSPKAARAVGRANGCNPIAIVVPCHRVIGSAGTLTGYGGGLARKQWLLDHETRIHRGSGEEIHHGGTETRRGALQSTSLWEATEA